MKKMLIITLPITFWTMFILAGRAAGEKRKFILREDLVIDVESGDENLTFGSVADIGLDALGHIFILDWEGRRLQVFDSQGKFLRSIVGKPGQGPEEIAMLGGLAVSPSGSIAVLDRGGNKVVLFSRQGAFRSYFRLDFQANYLGYVGGERIVVPGLNKGKILHLFAEEGHLLSSFAEPFEVPSEFSKYKDMPMMKCPLRFSCSARGSIFLFNPHKFEIFVYRDSQLVKRITGKSELFVPLWIPHVSSQRVALRFPFLTMLEFGERLYVTVLRPEGEGPNDLFVFENDRPVASLPVVGMPRAVDSQGRLYCAVETDFPRLVRYVISEE